MKIGTKSVLFGAHCFFIHPWFVAWAWWKLYGFPWDPRLWVAFFVHDLGYLGKPNMDGEEGEQHPRLGAGIVGWLFDGTWGRPLHFRLTRLHIFAAHWVRKRPRWLSHMPYSDSRVRGTWYAFVFYHSRYLAKTYGVPYSRLCVADKLAIALTPAWLYLPAVNLTGEIREYMTMAAGSEKVSHTEGQRRWYADLRRYMRDWVEEHKDGKADEWADLERRRKTQSGVRR